VATPTEILMADTNMPELCEDALAQLEEGQLLPAFEPAHHLVGAEVVCDLTGAWVAEAPGAERDVGPVRELLVRLSSIGRP
jgi:hypothetical protein